MLRLCVSSMHEKMLLYSVKSNVTNREVNGILDYLVSIDPTRLTYKMQ